MNKKRVKAKVKTLEEALKASMGARYNRVSKSNRKTVHEMSKCERMGGPIGSAPISEHD